MDIDLGVLADYELVIMAVAGLAVLFAGYRIKKLAFFIVWFLLGFTLANAFMPQIIKWFPEVMSNEIWPLLIRVLAGVLLAMLGFSVEKICVGGIAFVLVMVIAVQYFGVSLPVMVGGGILGIVAAGLAVTLMKPAIIVATAAAGAYVLTLAILKWRTDIDPTTFYFPLILGITVVGSVVQFLTTKRIS